MHLLNIQVRYTTIRVPLNDSGNALCILFPKASRWISDPAAGVWPLA